MSKKVSFRISVQLKGAVLRTARFSVNAEGANLTMQAQVVHGIRQAMKLVSEVEPEDVHLSHFIRSCKVLGLEIIVHSPRNTNFNLTASDIWMLCDWVLLHSTWE